MITNNIVKLTPYKTGKPIEEVQRELGLARIIKLASNESPFTSKKAKDAILNSLNQINRYPDGNCFYLKQKLAENLKVKPNNLLIGNGSDEVIDIIIKTFVCASEEIITAKTTFLEYEIVGKINNRKVKTIPLKNFKYDLPGIKRAITKKTKVIFIANPNNPTGTYLNKKELKSFLKNLPSRIIVVLDEAYNEFVNLADSTYAGKYLRNKNVIILRTFSKIYGLAGLRIGYAVASARFVSFMDKVRPPFNVNSLAQAAALAVIGQKQFISKVRKLTLKEKKYLYLSLDRMKISYVPSETNFILIDTKKDSVKVFNDFLRLGIIVRDMTQYGLKNFIRVTIGTSSENKAFIKALKSVLGA